MRLLSVVADGAIMREEVAQGVSPGVRATSCLLYTSDDADDRLCVALGGVRIIKKKTKTDTILCLLRTHNITESNRQKRT